MARKRLSENGVRDALIECRGNLSAVAALYGVGRSSVHEFVNSRPELVKLAADLRESRVDGAEKVIHDAIEEANDVGTAKWYLAMKGKDRGYTTGEDDLRREIAELRKTLEEVKARGVPAVGTGGVKTGD
jgi:hypothetical protein